MSWSLTIASDIHPGGTSSTPRPASAPCKHHAHPELSRVRAGTTEDDRHSVWTAFAAATRPSVDFFALERAFSSWLFTHVDAERLSRTSADHRGRSVCVGSAWKKVADLRDLCYGYAHSQCFSRRRPPSSTVKLRVQTTCSKCPPPWCRCVQQRRDLRRGALTALA